LSSSGRSVREFELVFAKQREPRQAENVLTAITPPVSASFCAVALAALLSGEVILHNGF
jgi:hypothetical protein